MNILMKFLPFVIIQFHYIIFGMSLRCYQCNSEISRRCLTEAHLIDKFLLECPPAKGNHSGQKPTPFCSKINQWLYFTKKNRESVIRSCNYYHKFKDKCEIHNDRDSYLSICMCGTDGCNSGKKIRFSGALLFCILFLFLFFIIK